jgi:hypothetical protein
MTEQYVVIRYIKNDSIRTTLVEQDCFDNDCEGDPNNALPPGCTNVEVKGTVQIMGDTEFLGNTYVEED